MRGLFPGVLSLGVALLMAEGCSDSSSPTNFQVRPDAGEVCLNFNQRFRMSVGFAPPPIRDAGLPVEDSGSPPDDDAGDAGTFFPPPTEAPPSRERVRVALKLGLREGVRDMSMTVVRVQPTNRGAAITILRARANNETLEVDLDALYEGSFVLSLENAFPCNGANQTIALQVTLGSDGTATSATADIDAQPIVNVPTKEQF